MSRPPRRRPRAGNLFRFRSTPQLAAALAVGGVAPGPVFAAAGLPASALTAEVTAPLARMIDLFERASAALDDPWFGVTLAEQIPSGTFGAAELLVRSAPTLGAGLAALVEVATLINPPGRFEVVAGPTETSVRYGFAAEPEALGRHLNEYTVRLVVHQLGLSLGTPLPVTRAWFPHRRELARADAAARFGCEVRFGAPDVGFALPNAVLAAVPRTADPVVFAYMRREVAAALAVAPVDDVVAEVARVVEADSSVDAATVARRLGVTVRSLQRRLAEAGATFRGVRDQVRRRRIEALRAAGVSGDELARALGFAHARSLRRALDK
ncbi:MAG: AraC family transcriptional regulator ligand-binding domain-containing protein [Kofleriaceae bacterium]